VTKATQEGLALLGPEVEEQIEQSQYHHIPSRTREGGEVVVMPVEIVTTSGASLTR
jgi:hypothetical protein